MRPLVLTAWLCGVFVLSSLTAQENSPSATPPPPPLREAQSSFEKAETCHYQQSDGTATTITLEPGEAGTLLHLSRRDARGEFSMRATHATIDSQAPFALREAGGTTIEARGEGWQRIKNSADGTSASREWEWVGNGVRRGSLDPLPAQAVTELQLTCALRRVEWSFGTHFTLPILWGIDREPQDAPEPLRRGHLRCTGRETIDIGETRVGCWRIIVESQGRVGPIRAVYWIGAKAPYRLERLEEADGTTLELTSVTALVPGTSVGTGASSGSEGVKPGTPPGGVSPGGVSPGGIPRKEGPKESSNPGEIEQLRLPAVRSGSELTRAMWGLALQHARCA